MNIQDWFPLRWFDLLTVQETRIFSPTPQFKTINSLALSFLHSPTPTSYLTTGKTIALTRRTLVSKVMSLLFDMLSRWVIAFLPRSKHLLISGLQSPSAIILETPKIIVFPSICQEVMGPNAMILVFWMLSFKPHFHSPLSLSSRGSLVLLRFLP